MTAATESWDSIGAARNRLERLAHSVIGMGHVDVAAHVPKDLPGQVQLPLQRLVVVHRVVVRNDPTLHPRLAGQHAGVGDDEWPQPIFLGYSSQGYCASPMSRSRRHEVDGLAEGAERRSSLWTSCGRPR